MTNPDLQLTPCDWLRVGFRAGPARQLDLIRLCRHFDGAVIFREGEVMVLEIGTYPELIDEVLARLPRDAVTHLWRSGPVPISGERATPQGIHFLRHLTVAQNVHSSVCVTPPPGVLPGGGSQLGCL